MSNDSTPLLSNSSDPEIPSANDIAPPESSSLDTMIEWCTGGRLGWRQFFRALFVSVAWFFDGQQACISDFTDLVPTWHCNSDSTACESTSSLCDLSASDWSWDGISTKSIISEWDLQCSGSFVTGLPTSCFYMGCLVGGIIFATLADSSLGRKNMLVVSCLIMSLSAFATVFSTDIWTYSALRFVSGLGRATIGTCSLVLSSEIVGNTWRGLIGMVGLFVGTLGLLSLPAIAYVLRAVSWRYLYLATSLPGVVYCVIVFFFINESPKWLLMQGRVDEAMAILQRVTPTTKLFRMKQYVSNMDRNMSQSGMFSSLKHLFKSRWILNRLTKVMVLGFGIGMMYYGMLLGVGNLGFDIYLSVAFNALLVIPSYYVAYLLINTSNRKTLLLGFCTVSGVLSIVCAFMSNYSSVQIGIELVSFFFTCMAYNVLMIYTIELFPTQVRNSATSMMRQAIIVGVLFDPTLISIGRSVSYLTYLVFGLVVIVCGTAVIFLPETKGAAVAVAGGDQMEE